MQKLQTYDNEELPNQRTRLCGSTRKKILMVIHKGGGKCHVHNLIAPYSVELFVSILRITVNEFNANDFATQLKFKKTYLLR